MAEISQIQLPNNTKYDLRVNGIDSSIVLNSLKNTDINANGYQISGYDLLGHNSLSESPKILTVGRLSPHWITYTTAEDILTAGGASLNGHTHTAYDIKGSRWITYNATNGFLVSGSNSHYNNFYFPAGHFCYTRVYFSTSNTGGLSAGSTSNLFTIPTEYCPDSQVALTVFTTASNPLRARINSAGVVMLYAKEAVSTGYAVYVSGLWHVKSA